MIQSNSFTFKIKERKILLSIMFLWSSCFNFLSFLCFVIFKKIDPDPQNGYKQALNIEKDDPPKSIREMI